MTFQLVRRQYLMYHPNEVSCDHGTQKLATVRIDLHDSNYLSALAFDQRVSASLTNHTNRTSRRLPPFDQRAHHSTNNHIKPMYHNAATTTTQNHLEPSKMESDLTAAPTQERIPKAELSHGRKPMPLIGLGTAVDPPVTPEVTKSAILEAIGIGYRHFDTAYKYGSEKPFGEAVQQAIKLGLIGSRDEVFITSKLWVGDAHPHLVLPALEKTLRNLNMEYIDLFLIHWPVSVQPGKYDFPIKKEDFLPMDYEGVWAAMEECQKLELVNSIGVSNFTIKRLQIILATATIPPAVNQVEVNPFWQQKNLIAFCRASGIVITAYSPLGAIGTFYGSNRVLECEVLKDIAKAKGKTVPQVCLRWAHEQGIAVVVKSFNKERMKENLMILDWGLSEDDHKRINTEIPQSRGVTGWPYVSSLGPIKTLEEMWDGEL